MHGQKPSCVFYLRKESFPVMGEESKRRYAMRHIIKGALIALALAGASVTASAPAVAAVDFSVSLGNAAFGYSDGYWDRDHRWHAWRNRQESQYFRDHYGEHYVA